MPREVAGVLARFRRALRRFESSRSEEATPGGTRYTSEWKFEVMTEADELDGGWVAWIEGVPGCVSQGETEDEAIEHLGEAFGLAMSERALDAPVTPRGAGGVRTRTTRIA